MKWIPEKPILSYEELKKYDPLKVGGVIHRKPYHHETKGAYKTPHIPQKGFNFKFVGYDEPDSDSFDIHEHNKETED